MANPPTTTGPKFNPPPVPSTPENAPWEELQKLNVTLANLAQVMAMQLGQPLTLQGQVGSPASITVLPPSFGNAGSMQQMINVMLESTSGALGKAAVLDFVKIIDEAYQDEVDRQVLKNGIIDSIMMGFPAGCHHLVEVRVLYYPQQGGVEYIIPSRDDSFIKADDTHITLYPNYPVKAPGRIRVEWWNYDSDNSHEVPVYITVTPSRLVQ
jgi:hypothetical protein